MTSYLSNKRFKCGEAVSKTKPISAGVPQGSAPGPLLFTLHTANIPIHLTTVTATLADDTAIISPHEDVTAINHLQKATNEENSWTKKRKTKLKSANSVKVDFS